MTLQLAFKVILAITLVFSNLPGKAEQVPIPISQIDRNIRSIFQDSRGNLWFGTDGDGVCRFNGVAFTKFN